jgi:putative membrane protein
VSKPVADRRLHWASFGIGFVRNVPQFVVGLPAFVGFASDAGLGLTLMLVGAGLAVALGGALLSWLRFRYGVGEADVVIESGVLNRQRRIIPFERVQDIEIEQGLLARLFGVVTVRIETGGGRKDEGRLEAVARAEAHRLRDIIRTRGAADEAPTEEREALLFSMPLPRLLLAGLFNFSLLFLAAIGVVLDNLQPFLKARGIGLRELFGLAEGVSGRVTVAASLLLVALLVLLGVATGIVRTVMRDYGFRLWRARAGLRRKRGLFTRSEVVIPIRRIQVALIRSGLVTRFLGWFALEYQTLSADVAKSGHQAAAPFARMAEIVPILAETGHADLPAEEEYVRVSRRAVARRSVHLLLPLVPVSIALSVAFRFGWLVLPLFPLAVAMAVLHWKRHRYAVTERALVVVNGFMEQRLWVVPYERVQTIGVERGWLQRRLGLATLGIDTAGAGILRAPTISDLDEETAEALSGRLLTLHKAARASR